MFFRQAHTKVIQGSEARMARGVYIGHHERTGATLLLTPEGVSRGTGVVQLPSDQKWDPEFLATCKGLPWEVKPRTRQAPEAIFTDEAKIAPLPPAEPEPAAGRSVRRRYVTMAEVEKYGGTEGCKTCTMIAMGHSGKREPHSEACRA